MALQLRGDGRGRCQQGGAILGGRRSFLSSWSLTLKDSKSKCPGFAPHIHICIPINVHHVSTYETFYGRYALSGLWQFFWNSLRIMLKIPRLGRSTVGIVMCLYVNSIILFFVIVLFFLFSKDHVGDVRMVSSGDWWACQVSDRLLSCHTSRWGAAEVLAWPNVRRVKRGMLLLLLLLMVILMRIKA